MENQEHMYVCIVCGHQHHEQTEGRWEDLPDDFTCPECGCGKEDYETI
jgi:rubredoxin-NAD+ reductase